MKKEYFDFLNKRKDWFLVFFINSFIALTLTLIGEHSFSSYMVFSQCIGFSISGIISAICIYKKMAVPSAGVMLIAIPLGVFIGLSVAIFILKYFLGVEIKEGSNIAEMSFHLGYSVLIGIAVSIYFIQKTLKEQAEKALIKQQLNEQKAHSALINTELKLLQAQIEPHFLFNTLSNVISLIDQEPDTAKSMLQSLTQYLRIGLKRTREDNATVADEVALLESYLSIQKIRMAERLSYNINADDDALALPLPALLIQPLVENALKHGIEKQVEGGEIIINISKNKQQLEIEVKDTGQGMGSNLSNGIGLKNVEQRLKSVYGESAKMLIKANQPQGVIVQLIAPINSPINKG